MKSLLGSFYSRIRGSQEDIASEGLVYILKRSEKARKVLLKIIAENTGIIYSKMSFSTQSTGDNLERPDISGINENGDEVFLIEAKFWASLTKNQPNEYLKRLGGGSSLLFLVPVLRCRVVYEEVLQKILAEFSNIEKDDKLLRIRLKNSEKIVFIKSWNEVLELIRLELIKAGENELLSDINQIIGLCDEVDSNSFQPIVDDDLAPSIPKKINSYYDIVEKVVDDIKNKNQEISIKGLQKTPQKYGYRRYFKLKNFGLGMALKMELWAEYADTPFWLSISKINERSWSVDNKLKNKCEIIADEICHKYVYLNNEIFISLIPQKYNTEDSVIEDLVAQIFLILQKLNEK